MARILLGVGGGIAAYKALELVRELTGAGHSVRALQSKSSLRFVGSESLRALTGAPVLVGEFDADPARGAWPGETPPAHLPIGHLALAERAELYVIAPATAGTLSRLAAGAAENMITACALAARCPLVLAPAMNGRMWEHPATQANVALLAGRGACFVGPESGRLASRGEHGVGRLAEPAAIAAACEALLVARSDLAGRRLLVTAGGTREPIDAVRYVGNRSSGRMGFALAEQAAARGAQVTLIAANVALPTPPGVERIDVASAAELAAASRMAFAGADAVLMAAAVADFAPQPAQGKIKRAERETLELKLERTVDVLAQLRGERREGQAIVGFAAEHGPAAVELATEKLAAKDIDAIVVNDVADASIGFDSEDNEVTVLLAERHGARRTHVPRASKPAVADAVLDALKELLAPG
jgi:phosphopantothenoylcysteine decarboxylase/phosphopantothenate--cysteine ligase